MPNSKGPIELLREHRRMFETQAGILRSKQRLSLSKMEQTALGAEAYAWENAVRQIDVTLRDWA